MGDTACLAVNDVGKPCAGEPHARFDRGPLAKRPDPGPHERESDSPALNDQATDDQPAAYLTCVQQFGRLSARRLT